MSASFLTRTGQRVRRFGRRQAIFIAMLVVSVIAALLASRAFLSSTFARRPSTGPMFREWVQTDWGWGWGRDRDFVHDNSGSWVFDDSNLNLLVVVVTAESSSSPTVHHFGEDSATFFMGTPHETTVGRMTDALVLVGPDGACSTLSLVPGGARRFYDMAVKNADAPVLDTLSECGVSVDRDALRRFIESTKREWRDY